MGEWSHFPQHEQICKRPEKKNWTFHHKLSLTRSHFHPGLLCLVSILEETKTMLPHLRADSLNFRVKVRYLWIVPDAILTSWIQSWFSPIYYYYYSKLLHVSRCYSHLFFLCFYFRDSLLRAHLSSSIPGACDEYRIASHRIVDAQLGFLRVLVEGLGGRFSSPKTVEREELATTVVTAVPYHDLPGFVGWMLNLAPPWCGMLRLWKRRCG